MSLLEIVFKRFSGRERAPKVIYKLYKDEQKQQKRKTKKS